MKKTENITLQFYAEPFELPRVKYHVALPLERQLDVAREGTSRLLDMLDGLGVKATFSVRTPFASAYGGLVERMQKSGHVVKIDDQKGEKSSALYRLLPLDLCTMMFLFSPPQMLTFRVWEFCEELHNNEMRLSLKDRRGAGRKLIDKLAAVIIKLGINKFNK